MSLAVGHVAVIGCGNIGAALCDLLPRLSEVERLTLVDMDVYTEANLRGQAISISDVGVPKAKAQARRIRRIRTDIEVAAHVCPVEELPLGALKCDVIASCLDSRVSRMTVNEAAWRLGVPWIDAGVRAPELLVRTEVFLPGADAPCLECAFTQQHYSTMEVRHACQAGRATAPTNAPAYLGGHAASLQAAEIHRLLGHRAGDGDAPESVQLVFDLKRHEHFVSRNRRNPGCRFDHRVFAPAASGGQTLGQLLCSGGAAGDNSSFRALGKRFVFENPCPRCRRGWSTVRCLAAGILPHRHCRYCGSATPIHPASITDRLDAGQVPAWLLARSPRSLGLRNGDLFSVTNPGGERHYLLGEENDFGRTS